MSFHHFAQLPKELQLAIWKECLPRRVVELDAPHRFIADMDLDPELRETTGCELSHTSRENVRPPVITRICRESRALALQNAGFVYNDDVVFGCSMPRVWLDRARDILHLNWEPAYDPQFERVGGDPLSYLMSTAAVGVVPVSLNQCGFLTLIESPESSPGQGSPVGILGPCCRVCLKMVSIHAGADVAIRSGLFGRLGEERIVLVDATDKERKRQFRTFWEETCATQGDRQAAYFFDKYGTQDDLWARDCIEDLRISWLVLLWQQRRKSSNIGDSEDDDDSDDAWVKKPGDESEGEMDDWEGMLYTRKLWIPNMKNAWMRSTIRSLPRLQPCIMFRLCTQKCI